MNPENIGVNLRAFRKANGFSQRDIYGPAGITRGRLSQIECGSNHASLKSLLGICKATGLTPNDLLQPPGSDYAEGETILYGGALTLQYIACRDCDKDSDLVCYQGLPYCRECAKGLK